ncbi:hypothetical protein [Dyella terrae]|uniref:hypothetical protein n=1 Tax=Dyella terrae TaxID=522259 RepID=UPI001EFD3772|nr:hypothetical protein [Dyella terrae]ULU25424.1 hypothetical protein DYST_02351 [Dyella terrae]
MDSATLTFAALNARIDQLPNHESLSTAPTKRQRWGYVVRFGSGFTGLLAIKPQLDAKPATVFAIAAGHQPTEKKNA